MEGFEGEKLDFEFYPGQNRQTVQLGEDGGDMGHACSVSVSHAVYHVIQCVNYMINWNKWKHNGKTKAFVQLSIVLKSFGIVLHFLLLYVPFIELFPFSFLF